MRKRPVLTYNILLPIWLLIWFPSWLWILLIPANYLIDRIVLHWSLKGLDDRNAFCRRATWKICVAGFLSDFVGSALLFGMGILLSSLGSDVAGDIADSLMFDPFGNIGALACALLAVALAGLCIFLLDRRILNASGLDQERARTAALRLALITAPYLFLIPSSLLYR